MTTPGDRPKRRSSVPSFPWLATVERLVKRESMMLPQGIKMDSRLCGNDDVADLR
jgi:hypothetical protein